MANKCKFVFTFERNQTLENIVDEIKRLQSLPFWSMFGPIEFYWINETFHGHELVAFSNNEVKTVLGLFGSSSFHFDLFGVFRE